MKTIFFAFLFSMTFFSYNKPVVEDLPQSGFKNDKFFVIKYEDLLKQEKKITLSQIASNVEYISLETKKECLIGALAKYYFADSIIFVSDKDHILKFSTNGKFLKRIGNPGRGPGELNSIWMMSVIPDKRILVVHDAGMRKLIYFSFDGKLIKTVTTPSVRYVKVTNDEKYIAIDAGTSKSEKYTFRLTNESWDTISVVKNYTPWTNTTGAATAFIIPSFEPFYTYKNKVYFKTMHNDTIYVTNKDKIIPSYFIDLGKYKLPDENRVERLNAQAAQSFKANSKKYYFAGVFEAGGRIFLTTNNYANGHILNYVINKDGFNGSSPSSSSEISKGIIPNDLDGGISFWPKGSVDDYKVFMPVDILRLKKYLDLFKTSTVPIKFPEKQKKLQNLVSKLDIDSNPILMVVTLKSE